MNGWGQKHGRSNNQKGGIARDEESMGKDVGDGIDLCRPFMDAGARKRFRANGLPGLFEAPGGTGFFAGKSPGEAGGYSGLSRPGHSFGFLGYLVTELQKGGALLIKVICPVSIPGFSFLPSQLQRKPQNHPAVYGEGIPAVPGSSGPGRESGAAFRSMDDSDQLSD